MSKEFYAIYHKPTGKYMPARMFENSRAGWTWWEPTGIGGYGGFDPAVPRLFTKKGSATQAMGYWLNGNYKLRVTGHYGGYEAYFERLNPEIPRNPNDVEIHVITLTVKAIV